MGTPPEPNEDPRLAELREAYQGGNLIAFVGAGVSAAAGLPTSRALTEALLKRLRARGEAAEVVSEVEALAAACQFIDALSAVKRALGPPDFGAAVERALNDEGREVPEVAAALAQLKPKLRAVLTTNLDHLLERALGWTYLASAPANIATRRGIILKLHGTLLDQDTWVFSRDEYDHAVFGSPNLQEAFGALYRTYPMLFIGCDLAEDNLDHLFGRIRALAGEQPPVHYALLQRRTITPFRRQRLEAAGLRLIGYDAAADLPAILHRLAGAPPPAPARQSSPNLRYVHRPREEDEAMRLLEEGQPVALMGPDRFGKSSLLRHLLERVRQGGAADGIIEMDLRDLGVPAQASLDDWMTAFAACLVHALNGDPARAGALRGSPVPWRVKLTSLVERELFPRAGERLVLAIDNADASWGLPFQDDVFHLLRSWCELGAQRAPWDRLRLLMALSTTPALLHDGPSVSPWNLAPEIHLGDFTAEQVRALAALHGKACTDEELRLLMERVGGHPWLIRVVVERWRGGEALGAVIAEEAEGAGKLARDLVGVGERLRKAPGLVQAVCAILDDPGCDIGPHDFDRLRRAGVAQVSAEGYRIRFPLYETYLRERWRPSVERKA